MKVVLMLLVLSSTAFADGKMLFSKNCKACHTIGGGDKIGPDLAGVNSRRKFAWIKKFVAYPDGMINGDEEEEGYEKPDAYAKKLFAAYKPTMMQEIEISDADLKSILKFIKDQKKSPKGKILKIK